MQDCCSYDLGKTFTVKRVFIAIKIEAGQTLLEMMSSLTSGLKTESIKWVNPQNVHITLAFLGDTIEEKIPSISEMLKSRCEGFGSFEIIIKGLGVFKNINDPRVIWTGIEKSEKLARLHNIILEGLNETGIEMENRPFRPHLTLGRIRHMKSVNALQLTIDKYSESVIQNEEVNEVILFESTLFKTGPVYTPIGKHSF